jgi:hypothetical protein
MKKKQGTGQFPPLPTRFCEINEAVPKIGEISVKNPRWRILADERYIFCAKRTLS